MKKRLLTILLSFTLIFTFMPAGALVAFADGGEYAGKIVILHSNDVHGQINGYQYMAGLKADYQAKGADVILADVGDFSQGTTYVSTSKGATAVEMMNAVGYDLSALGNHEFDYGYAQLADNLKAATFQVLCANILKDGKSIYPGHAIIEKDGVKIGFFGVDTPNAKTTVNPALIKDITFLSGDKFTKCVKSEAKALKKEGADIVIALTHLGVDAESEPYRADDVFKDAAGMGVDFVLDAHSHTVMTSGEKGEPIQSTGTKFENIGVVVIDEATKKIEKNELIPLKDADGNYLESLTDDKTVADMAQAIIDKVKAEYGEVFATSEVTLNGGKTADPEHGFTNGNRDGETNSGDLIAEAMLWSVQSTGGIKDVKADHVVAITNGGGIRDSITPGDVTKNDIKQVLPFGNTVAVVYVSGEKLLETLEASTFCTPEPVGAFPQIAGMEVVVNTAVKYDAKSKPYPGSEYNGPKSIKRVTIKTVGGKKFDPKAKYAVVTNNFCAAGGDTYYALASSKSIVDTGVTVDEAVMDFVKSELGGVIGKQYAEPQGRLSLVNVKLARPVVKLSKGKSKLTAKWASSANATSYTVKYAQNKKFKKAKTITVKTNKAKIKKLKCGKYYVKVRANTTAGGVKYHSKWSKVKSVK